MLQALDVLTSYPNEYWKYPVVIYYMKHRSEALFDQQFLRFLRKLIAELLTRYLLAPTINAVNMVHPGRGIFGSDFGTTTFVIGKKHIPRFIHKRAKSL